MTAIRARDQEVALLVLRIYMENDRLAWRLRSAVSQLVSHIGFKVIKDTYTTRNSLSNLNHKWRFGNGVFILVTHVHSYIVPVFFHVPPKGQTSSPLLRLDPTAKRFKSTTGHPTQSMHIVFKEHHQLVYSLYTVHDRGYVPIASL